MTQGDTGKSLGEETNPGDVELAEKLPSVRRMSGSGDGLMRVAKDDERECIDWEQGGGGGSRGGSGGVGEGGGGSDYDAGGLLGDADSQRAPPPKRWRQGMIPGKAWKLDGLADVLGLNDSSYDWGWLCKPRSPWSAPGPPPPFFGNEEALPWIVAVTMGLQHAISMLASIVTVPLFIGGPFNARLTQEEQQYLIAAGMIYAGFGSLIQVHRFRLPNGFFLGTGLICVIGTSFTFVPIATAGIQFMMREDTDRRCDVDAQCTPAWAGQSPPYIGVSIPGVTNVGQCNTDTHRCRASGQEAYGRILGTCILGSFLEVALSFTPKRLLRRIIPHSVTGICVTLIGVGLTGTGMMYWGGGHPLRQQRPQARLCHARARPRRQRDGSVVSLKFAVRLGGLRAGGGAVGHLQVHEARL